MKPSCATRPGQGFFLRLVLSSRLSSIAETLEREAFHPVNTYLASFFVVSDSIGPRCAQRCAREGCEAGWHRIEVIKVRCT